MPVSAQSGYQLFDQLEQLGWSEDDRLAVARTYELSMALCGGIERPFGRPFLDHCLGTASLVAEGGGRRALVEAALLHNIAGRHPHRNRLQLARAPYQRRLARRVAGDEVVELVDSYANSRADHHVDLLGDRHGREIGLLAAANALDDIIDGRAAYLPDVERTRQIERCRAAVRWLGQQGFDGLAERGTQAIKEAEAVERTAIGTPPLRGFRVLLRIGSGWRNTDPSVAIILFDHRVRKLIDPFRRGWVRIERR